MGIIPARAGFTGDEPHQGGEPGSSPLARGLHRLRRHEARHHRIIPARAGFTPTASGVDRRRTDHPRSRGVYAVSYVADYLRKGSSPLARGLLGRPMLGGHCPRIIPARAGFTGRAPSIRGAPGNHPRSRGVYTSARVSASHSVGSSPLARGLPVQCGASTRSPGIIPARAGFTASGAPTASHGGDHPRSRGVYAP